MFWCWLALFSALIVDIVQTLWCGCSRRHAHQLARSDIKRQSSAVSGGEADSRVVNPLVESADRAEDERGIGMAPISS